MHFCSMWIFFLFNPGSDTTAMLSTVSISWFHFSACHLCLKKIIAPNVFLWLPFACFLQITQILAIWCPWAFSKVCIYEQVPRWNAAQLSWVPVSPPALPKSPHPLLVHPASSYYRIKAGDTPFIDFSPFAHFDLISQMGHLTPVMERNGGKKTPNQRLG